MPPIKPTSIFGNLTGVVQARIDAATQVKKQIFAYGDVLSRLFDYGLPGISTDFEALLGAKGISIAAPTVAMGANEPIVGSRPIEIFKDKMFRHAISSAIDSGTQRKILQILDSKTLISEEEKKRQLIEIMFGTVTDRVNGVNAKLFMIAMGMLSNHGSFTYTAENNPEGVLNGTSVNQNFKNRATVTKSWGNADVDVFEDINEHINLFPHLKFDKIFLSQDRLSYILKNVPLKKAVFGQDRSSTPLLLNDLNAFMQANDLPIFEAINSTVRVQSGRGIVDFKAWNDKSLVFAPSGKLGTIENAFADGELSPEDGVTYSHAGRILISQWRTGRLQGGNNAEHVSAEIIAQPVFTVADSIATLTVVTD